MTEPQKEMSKKSKKVQRFLSNGGGLGSGVVVAWAWNAIFPDNQMPTEVAAAVGGGLVMLARWINDLFEDA